MTIECQGYINLCRCAACTARKDAHSAYIAADMIAQDAANTTPRPSMAHSYNYNSRRWELSSWAVPAAGVV